MTQFSTSTNNVPGGDTGTLALVASYANYPDAQRAVDYLSDQRFPVERLSIVGDGLKVIEQVTGRLNWGRALTTGLLSGAVTGAIIGLLFGLFSLSGAATFAIFLYGLIFGAIIGAVWSLIGYAFSGGRHDFTSVGGMRADRYNVIAASSVVDDAKRLLARMPSR